MLESVEIVLEHVDRGSGVVDVLGCRPRLVDSYPERLYARCGHDLPEAVEAAA